MKKKWIVLIALLTVSLLFTQCGKRQRWAKIGKKQIILISIDTLRSDHLTSYGYSRNTSPRLARLVEDAVYYPKAFTNGCWTMPSHVTLLTGTLPSRHGINQSWAAINKKYPKLNESLKNMAEILKAHNQNLKTIKFAKLPDELGFGNGFDQNNASDALGNKQSLKKVLKAIEKNKDNEFFFFLHTWKVHAPYTETHFLPDEKLEGEKRIYIHLPGKLPGKKEKQVENYRLFLEENNLYNADDCVTLYDSCIYFVDRYIGKIIDRCKQLGIYDDMMLIVMSDHGEHFADHNPEIFFNYHGKDYYEEFIQVPLIIKYPKETVKPQKIVHPVSLMDVLPTVLDFYSIDIPIFVQGDSLLKQPGKREKIIVSESVIWGKNEMKMIRVGDLKYIVTMDKPTGRARINWDAVRERRLYDLKKDPLEKNNLYNDLKFRNLCINLEKMLKGIIKESAATNRTTGETDVDPETLKQMKALGYL
ncbi:MAG: sulfatase-like hydrolase/transferase [bacterium]|nr:sulfatase-like hydrolase/transferase [bacterium]